MFTVIVQSPISRKTSFYILGRAGLLIQIITSFILLPRHKIEHREAPQSYNLDDIDRVGVENKGVSKASSENVAEETASLKKCILSRQCVCHVLWFSFMMLNILFFISSHSAWLNVKYPSNAARRTYFSTVFG